MFERRNCQRGCSDCVKLPADEAEGEQVDQVQFRRDGGGFTSVGGVLPIVGTFPALPCERELARER